MKQTLLLEKYPLFVLELRRDETDLASVDEICAHFQARIQAHRCAEFIGVFDHYAHTCTIPEGSVDATIRAAKNVIFCFGISLPSPQVLAVRPRSIGVAETDAGFVVSFMEAPMPIANAAMEDWAEALRREPEQPSPMAETALA